MGVGNPARSAAVTGPPLVLACQVSLVADHTASGPKGSCALPRPIRSRPRTRRCFARMLGTSGGQPCADLVCPGSPKARRCPPDQEVPAPDPAIRPLYTLEPTGVAPCPCWGVVLRQLAIATDRRCAAAETPAIRSASAGPCAKYIFRDDKLQEIQDRSLAYDVYY